MTKPRPHRFVRTPRLGWALLIASAIAFASAGLGTAQDGEAPARRVLIGASGDLLFHTRVVAAGRAHGFDHLFSGLRGVISEEEIAFANLETPLSEEHAPMRGDPPRLGAPPEVAAALAHAGIDVLSVANNHAWDQRVEGMVDTLAALRGAHIQPVGAAPSEELAPGPVVLERGGVRVAFVAFTTIIQGHPGRRRPAVRISMWDERRARRVLSAAREQADVVVASMHWGLGYRHDDRSEQRSRTEFLVRHGADVVLGHGPHVLQRAERMSSPRGEALVVYSLGNLISNQGYHYRRGRRDRSVERALREPATRDAVWFRVGVDLDAEGQVSLAGVEAVPLWTHNNYWDEERRRADAPDIQIQPLSSVEDRDLASDRRRAIGRVLGEGVLLLP